MDESDDGIRGNYDDGNRTFLQAFMARGTMTFEQGQPVLAAIFTEQDANGDKTLPTQITMEDFQSYVSAASEAISDFDLEIRSHLHQVDNVRIWAIVNTTSDPISQMATLHSAEEIAFIKRVIDAMFEKYNTPRMEVMCLDEMQANKLRAAPKPTEAAGDLQDDEAPPAMQPLKGLKSSEAEAVMRSMVEEGWFERSREGMYSLSPRALIELRAWLFESYNEPEAEDGEWQRIKICAACKDIVTVGQRCSDRDCNARVHDICTDALWRARRGNTCPNCNIEWTGKHFVGQRAVTETEAYQRGRRRSGKGGSSSNMVEEIMQGEEEGEEEEAEGEEEEIDE